MVDNAQPFRADLDELEQIVARLSGFVGFLNDSLEGLNQRISAVQQNWDGAAASAQADAFREWHTGATDVAERIEAMRQVVIGAHDRYQAAIAANLSILGRS
ncbi:WXG100 family type VII secretion target [Nocardia cyriacigeorgica]|uniref:WXG100 family type VII secretion target n=1 Tax=Nocardia cyriacigeorgica TaxID=135487 RepID=UPI001894E12B|nr:WXG100 family type VII secretion target [Nocardia cyriacigeorgica]MBF6316959.1 WXG100 family type VII secretion target [Nocardia cyriacigeorgica]MBF6532489.1 WXG100 family type VII secretion target [Nocardia cyriacigeorgica]